MSFILLQLAIHTEKHKHAKSMKSSFLPTCHSRKIVYVKLSWLQANWMDHNGQISEMCAKNNTKIVDR